MDFFIISDSDNYFSLLLIFIDFLIKIDASGPISIKQKISGMSKKIFAIYKFRTMKIDTLNVSNEKLRNQSLTL